MVTLTAYYTANVKEPPWIVVVNATIMQSWESEAGGYIVGGAFGKAIAKHDISCHFPGMVRAYYVADHDTIYRHIKPGDFWTWDGTWRLQLKASPFKGGDEPLKTPVSPVLGGDEGCV
jgi:hypothetical protein